MKKFTYSLIAVLFCICVGLNAQAQTVPDGETDVTTLTWTGQGDVPTDFNNDKGSTVFGTDDSGDNLPYVDVSNYGYIKLYGTAGQKARLFINRSEFDDNGIFFVDIDDNGVGTFDCNKILEKQPRAQYIHLNGVKASAWNTNLNLSLITVSGAPITFPTIVTLPDDETDITSLTWVNEGQGCATNFGLETDGTIFGTDAGPADNNLSYVDITNFGSIKLYCRPEDAGKAIRLFINRAEFPSNFQFYVNIGSDGIATLDLATVYTTQEGAEYVHLNGIKPNWVNVKMEIVGLTPKPLEIPEDEVEITTLPWVNEAQNCDNRMGEDTDATIYGTHDAAVDGKLSYVDITEFGGIKIYGREGDVLRCFINRAEYPGNFQFYVTIGTDGTGILDLADVYSAQAGAQYVHLNGIKTSTAWDGTKPSATGKAKVSAITLTEKKLFTIHADEMLTDEHPVNHIAKNSDGEWAANKIALDEAYDYKLDIDVIAGEVEYTRDVTADTWNAICLPFDVPCTALSGYDVIKLASIDGTELTFEYLAETDNLTAHIPYLIKSADASVEFSLNNTTVKAAATAISAVDGATLVGVYKAQVIPAGCYGLAGGEFKKAAENNTNKIKPYRAYLQTGSNGAQKLKISVNGDTSGIEEFEMTQPVEEGVFYNLNGQKVTKPTTGIYIFNGEKVYVK